MIRLFVALKVPDEIKKEIINHYKSIAENQALRWETDEKIHLTLKFIGEVSEEILRNIVNELDFVKNYSSFNCTISKFGFFFRDNQAKILWCDLETDDSIISLVDEINIKLQKFGISIEKRKFKGHLTLLRIKNSVDEKFIQRFKESKFDPVKFNSNEIMLIQSVLKPSGSEYKVLKIYELK